MKVMKNLDLEECEVSINLDLAERIKSDRDNKNFLLSIKKNKKLKSLNLSKNMLGSICSELPEALKACEQLEELNLSHNSLLAKDLPYIISIIKTHAKLKILNLSGNAIGNKVKGFNYFKIFSQALGKNGSIHRLNLKNTNLDHVKLKILLNELSVNSSLQELDLSENQFDAFGAELIGSFLQKNHTVSKLRLAYNQDNTYRNPLFFNKQCTLFIKPIFLALENGNNSLKELDIQGNEIILEDPNLFNRVIENKNLKLIGKELPNNKKINENISKNNIDSINNSFINQISDDFPRSKV